MISTIIGISGVALEIFGFVFLLKAVQPRLPPGAPEFIGPDYDPRDYDPRDFMTEVTRVLRIQTEVNRKLHKRAVILVIIGLICQGVSLFLSSSLSI
jgi:hypothetical protein